MVEVIAKFVDKYDNSKVFEVGQKLEWDDQERIDDCVKRGLVKVVNEEKKTTKKKPTKKKATKK